jgi:DNA-binding transcriptional ArsR family regulator
MTNITAMLAALGDPMRQSILDRLSDGPMPVGRLADVLPISRPAVSQHLRVLKEVGLVTDRQDGTRRLYQVDPDGVAALRAHLDGVWARSLAAFQNRVADEVRAAETTPDTTPGTAKDRTDRRKGGQDDRDD